MAMALTLKAARKLLYSIRSKWYSIGVELEIKIEELDTIRDKYNNDHGKSLVEMLKIWLKSLPTWKALADALDAEPIDEKALAEQARKHSEEEKENISPNATKMSFKEMTQCEQERLKGKLESDTTDIKSKFGMLLTKTEQSLENSEITAAKLKVLLSACVGKLADNIQSTDTIPDVMYKANKHNFWTFFSYTVLESVINAFCESQSLAEDLNSYKADFKKYCEQRLYEVPCDVLQAQLPSLPPHDSTANILCVKLDDNFPVKKDASTKLFSGFLEVQYKISKILGIEHLHLIYIEKGCIKLTFRYFTKHNIIPSIIADENKQASLKKLGVLHLESGEQAVELQKASSEKRKCSSSNEIDHTMSSIECPLNDRLGKEGLEKKHIKEQEEECFFRIATAHHKLPEATSTKQKSWDQDEFFTPSSKKRMSVSTCDIQLFQQSKGADAECQLTFIKSVEPTPTQKALQKALEARAVGEAELAENGQQYEVFVWEDELPKETRRALVKHSTRKVSWQSRSRSRIKSSQSGVRASPRCGRCGRVGHTKRSKKCPWYKRSDSWI